MTKKLETEEQLVKKFDRIKAVLARHYPTNYDGEPNSEFDDTFRSEDALDEIFEIVHN